jgi:predicted ester cyclase
MQSAARPDCFSSLNMMITGGWMPRRSPAARFVALGIALSSAGCAAQAPLQEGPAIARAIFTAIDEADYARMGALLDDSFQLHYQGVPDPISKPNVLELIRANFAAFPDMRHDLEDILPSGNHVTVRLVATASHRGEYEGVAATGTKVAVPCIHILRIANGKIVEWWAAEDDLGLLRQIGMVIKPPSSP